MKTVMDTPQFQRLRGLKQLGTSEYAYMNCNHNRFEHSVGVAYLAQRMCQRLKTNQSSLGITDKDVLCVKIAGLLHDLGHGPFSHIYDDPFPKNLQSHLQRHGELWKNYADVVSVERPKDWAHEDGSHMMIDAMLEELGLCIDLDNLDEPLKQIGDGVAAESLRVFSHVDDDDYDGFPSDDPLKGHHNQISMDNSNDDDVQNFELIMTSRDWVFIKEMISAEPLLCDRDFANLPPDESGFVGRRKRSQEFLYDIVSNRHNGLDVDKMDYFARDQRRAFRAAGEVEFRLIDEAVVAWGECPRPDKCFRCKHAGYGGSEQHLMICYPDKMVVKGMDFFHTRFLLHSQVYTHKTTQAATFMISDILTYADPFFRIPTSIDGDHRKTAVEGLPISRAMADPVAYLRLRDSIIDQIMHTTGPSLAKARGIIDRLWRRKLYKCVQEKRIQRDNETDARIWAKEPEEIQREILQLRAKHDGGLELHQDDFIVEKHKIHHGSKEDNPLLLMRFVSKLDRLKLKQNPSVDALPLAQAIDPDKYEGHIPRAFQEQNIRFFCRTPAKIDLLKHAVELWEQENSEQYSGFMVTHEEPGGVHSDEEDDLSVDRARQLTQDSDNEMTPRRPRGARTPGDEISPIPTGARFGSVHASNAAARRKIQFET